MRIIIIKSNISYYEEIKSIFEDNDNYLVEIDNYNNPTELVTYILQATKEGSFEAIFSLEYQPNLSLAAGALNMKYIVWETEGYNSSLYDSSITNQWNILFVANYNHYERLKKIGVDKCHFLPLGASGKIKAHNNQLMVKEHEFMLWSSAIYDDLSVCDAISATKDSTKGYIDGVAEVHKNYFEDVSIYSTLAKTVADDVETCYPPNLQQYETKADYYDHCLFGPIMDRTNAYPYFAKLDIRNVIRKIVVTSDINYVFDDGYHETMIKSSIVENEYEYARNYINVYIPQFDNRNMITYDVWNMMLLGIPVFVPCCMTKGLNESVDIISFRKPYDVELLIRKFISESKELQQYVSGLQQYVGSKCKLSNRIDEMMAIISSV